MISIGYIILAAIVAITLAFFIEWERPGIATICIAALIGTANYFMDGAIWAVVSANPLVIVLGLAVYLAVGLAWSFFKWYFYLIRLRDAFLEKGPGALTYQIPKASSNKFRIVTWMAYWPFSAAATIVNEPIRRLFLKIFSMFKGTYDKIATKVFSGVKLEMTEEERNAYVKENNKVKKHSLDIDRFERYDPYR